MFTVELLVNSTVVCIVTLCFEHGQQFPISHFTYHLRYYMINSNKPVKVAHFQKLAKQSVLCGALVTEKWLNNSFSESKKNFYPLIKWGTTKIYIFARFKFKYLTPHATSQLGLI